MSVRGSLCDVLHRLQKFSAMNNDKFCAHTRYNRISLNSFKHFLAAITIFVKQNNTLALPHHFAIVFDGQTTPETHYPAVFATRPSNNAAGYHTASLAMLPSEDETTYRAEELTISHVLAVLHALTAFRVLTYSEYRF